MLEHGLMRNCLRFCMWMLLVLAAVRPAWAEWQQGEYRIIRAQYGTAERSVDVTVRLKELARRDERFRLGNDVFGVDPDRGHAKVLRIYAVGPNGRDRIFEYTEGSWVDGAQFEGWRGGNWADRDRDRDSREDGGWGERPGHRDGGDGEYRILQARYGTAERNVDVTARLRELARRDERFRLGNDTFGIDPDRGRRKALRIYTEGPDGRNRSFEYTEGSWIDGAQFSGWSGGAWGQGGWRGGWGGERPGYADGYDQGRSGLQILRAEYGSDERRIDITYRLQQRVDQGRLNVRVDNDTAGDDPAERREKRLWITYSVDGREMSRVVKEGRVLTLP